MSEHTAIEWCDMTFNPWIGCTKVSPGCANCYAEREDGRFKWTPDGWGKGKERKRTSEANWKKVEQWNRKAQWEERDAEACGRALPRRPRVFVASLSDWLDPEVPIELLADLLGLIRRCQYLDFLLLTKRPQLWSERVFAGVYSDLEAYGGHHNPLFKWLAQWVNGKAPHNVWVGASVEDQPRADERIPALLDIPAVVRFLSCEPLLSRVDLPLEYEICRRTGLKSYPFNLSEDHRTKSLQGIHWVICGGESGPNARPIHPDWARSLRDQCQAAGVPFFFKQWGEWVPGFSNVEPCTLVSGPNEDEWMVKAGKKRAGRLLDGREWNEFPVVGGAS